VANHLGLGSGDLYDASYNMTLGTALLGQLVTEFDGSYVMAAAAYNAGRGRPAKWASECGDPRAGADPVNFIECIPFDETRNYVMRVLEATQVYRARLRGGVAPDTLAADLRRGGYGPVGGGPVVQAAAAAPARAYPPSPGPTRPSAPAVTMAPIPDP
jgi:soluble lytic murein transglycosylase